MPLTPAPCVQFPWSDLLEGFWAFPGAFRVFPRSCLFFTVVPEGSFKYSILTLNKKPSMTLPFQSGPALSSWFPEAKLSSLPYPHSPPTASSCPCAWFVLIPPLPSPTAGVCKPPLLGPHGGRWAAGGPAEPHLPPPIACVTAWPSPPRPWKNCLPRNRPLVPERLGTAALLHLLKICLPSKVPLPRDASSTPPALTPSRSLLSSPPRGRLWTPLHSSYHVVQ